MEMMKRFEPLALLLMMLVAFNWAIDALFDTNVINEIFGTGTARDVAYVVVGIAALMLLPRLAEELNVVRDRAHPRGA